MMSDPSLYPRGLWLIVNTLRSEAYYQQMYKLGLGLYE